MLNPTCNPNNKCILKHQKNAKLNENERNINSISIPCHKLVSDNGPFFKSNAVKLSKTRQIVNVFQSLPSTYSLRVSFHSFTFVVSMDNNSFTILSGTTGNIIASVSSKCIVRNIFMI